MEWNVLLGDEQANEERDAAVTAVTGQGFYREHRIPLGFSCTKIQM